MKYRRTTLIIFLAPVLLFYFVIFLAPTVNTFLLSFFHATKFVDGNNTFVGLRNYLELFKSPLFKKSVSNVFLLWIIGGFFTFFFSFMFIFLLRSGIKGKSFFRSIIYLPNLIPVVAATTMWTQYIYHPKHGFFIKFFSTIGLDSLAAIQWTGTTMIFWSMMIAITWGSIGWFVIILYAGIDRIPNELFESATLDGAGKFRQFTSITMPLLRDVIRICITMFTIITLNHFAYPKLFTSVNVVRETYVPAVYMYELAFGMSNGASGGKILLGKGSAVGVLILIIIITFSVLINKIFDKFDKVEY